MVSRVCVPNQAHPKESVPLTEFVRTKRTAAAVGSAFAALTLLATGVGSDASSHRDAPVISQDPVADNTDVYAFVAPDKPDHVTLISNFIPLQAAYSGPNFHNFGDDVLYEIHVDNDGDASADVSYQFRFATEVVDGNTFLYNEGPITFEDGAYTNLNIRQTYTVTEVKEGEAPVVIGSDLVVPPANIGPRSTPNYETLAAAGVHDLGGGISVFAGPRDEAFPVDLGSIFDLGALRSLNAAHVIPLDPGPGVNATLGFNVHSIALQVPKGEVVEADPVIGVHSTASRFATTTRGDGATPVGSGDWVQISRLGHPLVNEVVVPLAFKDVFNTSPLGAGDAAFLPVVQDPRLGQLLPVLYPGAFDGCYPTAPRDDLVTIFLTGIPGVNQPEDVTPSEQLRLNTSLAPTPFVDQDPMGLLAGQLDGFPNGRRPIDDVVDIELQAVAGATPVGDCAGVSPNNLLGDGVSGNDMPFLTSFPYLPHPHAGYEADGHADAPDSQNRVDQVRRLYLAYFGRAADDAGLDFWVDGGQPIQEVSEFFAQSAELQALYGDLDNGAFIDRLYLNVLGRPGDSEGRDFWVGELDAGASRGRIMLQFSNSPEFITRVSAR